MSKSRTPSMRTLEKLENSTVYVNGNSGGSGYDSVSATYGGRHYAAVYNVANRVVVELEEFYTRDEADRAAVRGFECGRFWNA